MQSAFTAHVALLLRGRALPNLLLFLMSAPIIPLAKSGGGVRPVAVGEVWLCLTLKVAFVVVNALVRTYLLPF